MYITLKPSSVKFLRYFLGGLLLFVAANAFGGGYYGMAGAKDIPLEWLNGSPFQDYFIPGLFLFIVIGGLSLYCAFVVFKNYRKAHKIVMVNGIIILLWIGIQVAIIGYVSWMQPTTLIAAVVILVLNRQLNLS